MELRANRMCICGHAVTIETNFCDTAILRRSLTLALDVM